MAGLDKEQNELPRADQWNGGGAQTADVTADGHAVGAARQQGYAGGGFQESEWQDAGPVQRRYLAADMYDDDDEDMDDEEAIPGTP